MNVACEKCSAKYAVPDAKVKGRKVRITCKRCGAPIVVDGRALASEGKSAEKPAAAKPADARATDAKPAAAKPAPVVARPQPRIEPAKPAETARPAAKPIVASGPKPVRPETPPTAIASAVTKPPTAQSTMLGGLNAPATGVTAPNPQARGLGPKPAQRTMLGGVTAPRPATPIASKAAVKQTLMGGLSPAFGAAPSPKDAGGAPKPAASTPHVSPATEGEREWTVAVTDEDHYEMNTDEVVQAFTQGNIDEETFIWKEGMDDWLTPFEVPGIAAALRKAGLRPKGENPMAFDDATRVGPSPMDKKPAVDPTPKPGETQGVWKEPGDWKPMAAPGVDLSFDDVTVAMAAPQSRQLLQESRDIAAAKQAAAEEEEEELTLQGESPLLEQIRAEARLKEGLKTVPPPAPAAGAPYAPPPVEPKVQVAPLTPTPAPAASPIPKPVPSPTPPSPLAPAAAADSVDASELGIPVSVEADSVDDLLGDPSVPSGDTGEDEKTGARNEDSVLFSLDAIGPGGAKPKPAKLKSTLLGMAPPPPPRPAHLSSPGIEAEASPGPDLSAGIGPKSPDFPRAELSAPEPRDGSSPELGGGSSLEAANAPGFGDASFSSPAFGSAPAQAELTAPLDGPDPLLSPPMDAAPASDFAVPKKSGGGVWIALVLILLVVGGGAAYAYTQGLGPFAKPVSKPTPTETSNLAPAGQPTTEPTATEEPTSPAAEPSASAGNEEEPGEGAANAKTGTQGKPEKLERKPDEGVEEKDEAPDEKAEEKAEKPDEKNEAEAEKPDEKAEEEPDGAPFDEVAARNALASAAGSAAGCKKPDGPTGQGRAIVTFAPSGRVTSAVITGAFAGTTVGGCIARVFRGATVPAFSGGPKTVSKTFSVE